MGYKIKIYIFIILLFIGIEISAIIASAQTNTAKKENDLSWSEPQDTNKAINNPDEYAWRLFVALNWPADMSKRQADPSKTLGADGPTVWESWKNANDVYLQNGTDPGSWEKPETQNKVEMKFDAIPLQQLIRKRMLNISNQSSFEPQILAPPSFEEMATTTQGTKNETRLNKTTYDYIRHNELFNIEGQEKLFESNISTIDFPVNSKEVKAQWREINENEKSKYHWTIVKDAGGKGHIIGLTALHIATKDLPNWFWATFEHVDNPKHSKDEKWLLPSVDRVACHIPPYDCNRIPTKIGLENTKWEYYRLRGTQVNFVDSKGNPIRLANSQIEKDFQSSSSCITCHAFSSIGPKAKRIDFFDKNGEGFIGAPDPQKFKTQAENGITNYTQLDFVWSLFRAKSKFK